MTTKPMFRKIEKGGERRTAVTITVDGSPVTAEEGEPVAAALLRVAPFIARTTPVSGSQRAPYCMMGVCFDCLVEVDGVTSVRSCIERVRDGMAVRRQDGRPAPAEMPAS